MAGGGFRELLKKYGKVALVVHCSVSITGLYVAIQNNLDVESALDTFLIRSVPRKKRIRILLVTWPKRRTGRRGVGAGGALFPVRVPVTIALTPPIARFLARRRRRIIS